MLKTLDDSLKVIRMFTRSRPEWGGRELAQEMKMDHAKIYRILETFESNNFLRKDPVTKKYSLGLAAWELGMNMYNSLNPKQIIHPVLEELFKQTGESVFLTLLDKDQGVTFEAIEPDNKVKFSVSVGSRAPLYVGASYRSILAFMPDDFVENYLNTYELKQYTEKTKTDRDELRAELQMIRENGWSMSEGEYTPDIIAIAVPLFQQNRIIGSLTVSGPNYRMSQKKINESIPFLKMARDELADMMEKYQLKIRL